MSTFFNTGARFPRMNQNSLLSTGPKSTEGKERSRRNAFKHGLTGDGVALPDEDAAEVASRFQELEAELLPSGVSSRLLLRRFAYLSVRLERCERLDTAVYSKRIRHADADFVDMRMTRVEELASRINCDPMTTARRLQNSPEGIDWLINHWGDIRRDLMNRERNVWSLNHWSRLERLLGRPEGDFRQSKAHALTEALSGFFQNINPSEIEGLHDAAKVDWARHELSRIIDDEVDRLYEAKLALDPTLVDQDRLEAASRCLFDLQPAMNQVRKYEAATERGMYRALKEFRALEVTLKANGNLDEKTAPPAELASFDPEAELAETVAESPPRNPINPTETPETAHVPSARSLDNAPNFFGAKESRLC